MPAMCNPDYTAMELIHARLIRKTICANGCVCDYTICGDKDEEYLKQHEEKALIILTDIIHDFLNLLLLRSLCI